MNERKTHAHLQNISHVSYVSRYRHTIPKVPLFRGFTTPMVMVRVSTFRIADLNHVSQLSLFLKFTRPIVVAIYRKFSYTNKPEVYGINAVIAEEAFSE